MLCDSCLKSLDILTEFIVFEKGFCYLLCESCFNDKLRLYRSGKLIGVLSANEEIEVWYDENMEEYTIIIKSQKAARISHL